MAKEPIKPTSVKIPTALKKKIQKAAKEAGQTVSGRIIFLLEQAHKK